MGLHQTVMTEQSRNSKNPKQAKVGLTAHLNALTELASRIKGHHPTKKNDVLLQPKDSDLGVELKDALMPVNSVHEGKNAQVGAPVWLNLWRKGKACVEACTGSWPSQGGHKVWRF